MAERPKLRTLQELIRDESAPRGETVHRYKTEHLCLRCPHATVCKYRPESDFLIAITTCEMFIEVPST